MPHDAFDTDGLARFLHLSPKQVERAAERGNLPGRKVGGQWRFSRAEIHHWMEDRMGLLDDEELAQVEGALNRRRTEHDDPLSVAQMLPVEAIAVPLIARTRTSVIHAVCELAASTGLLWDAKKMAEAVLAREDLMSTALDSGVALLHPRRPLPAILAEPLLALGITSQGIPFGGSAALTDVFFLIGSTDDRTHLQTLARISRLIGDGELLPQLRAAEDPAAVHALIAEREKGLRG